MTCRRFAAAVLTVLPLFPLGAAEPQPGGSANEVEALIGQLSSPEEKVRHAAQEKLVRLGDEARAALEAHVRAKVAAETVLQRIEVNKVAGPTLVTLDLKDASPEATITEICKQTGFVIQPSHESVWQQVSPTAVTLNVKQQPFWNLMRDACARTGLAIYNSGNNDRRIRLMAASQLGQNLFKCPAVINGAFMITVNSLQRSSTVNMANPQDISRSMYLQMTVFCEPKVRVIQYSYVPEIDEAVDEKGNSLINTSRGGAMRQMSSGGGILWNCSLPLQYPGDAGQKIAKLRGKLRFVVQTRSETLEIPDVLKSKDVTKTVAGRRVLLKEFRKTSEGQYQARVVVYREGVEQQQFHESINNPGIRLIDADGREFTYNGANSSNSSNDTYEANFIFSVRGGMAEPNAPGEPATLLWEFATASQEITIPFDFGDLPLP